MRFMLTILSIEITHADQSPGIAKAGTSPRISAIACSEASR